MFGNDSDYTGECFKCAPAHSRRRDAVSEIWMDKKESIQEIQKGKTCSVLWNMIEGACRALGRIVHLACREVVGEGRGGESRTVIWRQMEWDFPEHRLDEHQTPPLFFFFFFILLLFLNAHRVSVSSSLPLSRFSPAGYPSLLRPHPTSPSSFPAEMTPRSSSLIRICLASLWWCGAVCVFKMWNTRKKTWPHHA